MPSARHSRRSGARRIGCAAGNDQRGNFIGRLGRDPESRYLASGDQVVNFSIAVGWKGKDKEGAEWISIVAFGKLAGICGQYLKKGSQVFISGKFKTDKYQDKDGNDRYSTKIVADNMQMLGGRQDSEQRPQQEERRTAQSSGGVAAKKPAQSAPFADMDDDIPF
jgi:single-strand DNA-binding protein